MSPEPRSESRSRQAHLQAVKSDCTTIVVKARADTVHGKTLAVKVLLLPPAFIADDNAAEKALKDFGLEQDTLPSIWHQNVMRIWGKYDMPVQLLVQHYPLLQSALQHVVFPSLPATIMSWIGGPAVTLDKFIWSSALKVHLPLLLRIGEQIAMALDALHSAEIPVVHRDLAPDNIMITYHGCLMFHVHLVDFGLSRFVARTGHLHTNHHLVCKTSYIAPELLNAAPGPLANGCQVDIFSLGMVLLFMATGGVVHGNGGPSALMQNNVQSRSLALLINQCTSHDASIRPSAWEVYRRLVDVQFEQMRANAKK